MSILSSMFSDLLSVVAPTNCIGCGKPLDGEAEWLCIRCMAQIPTTEYHTEQDNIMALKVRALCPSIANATAQYYYIPDGIASRLIKRMKYHSSWYLAYKFGEAYGYNLAESPIYQGIDFAVPVPLHPLRMISRRYNQAELIAKGIAKRLKIRVDRNSLRRTAHNPSQVSSEREQRWRNVQGIFHLKHPERFEGKHILLVDDVFTTGATLISCAEAISAAAPTCRISIATLAISAKYMINN